MSWLKKIGTILQTIGGVVGLLPTFKQIIPQTPAVTKVESEFEQAGNIVVMTEAIVGSITGGSGKGADKLKAAAPLVAQLLLSSPLMLNKKIKDQALFNQAATGIASGFADLLNSIDGDSVPAPAPAKTA